MTGTIALRLEHVSHEYDGRSALHDVSVDVVADELVAIVGPSGCGKTTLLRIGAGLQQASEGTVSLPSVRRGVVFQEPALLPWRRVSGNARLFSEANDEAYLARLLEATGLTDHANKWPYQLSGGMKMRLSLVRALASKPDLLLLDEPFGSLDHITRQRLQDELGYLHETFGFAAVLVTHAIDEAVFLADRVLVLSGAPGRIVGEFRIPFERRRSENLRYSAPFGELCGRIAACLREHS